MSGERASDFAAPTIRGLGALKEVAEAIGRTQGFKQGMEVEEVVAAQTVGDMFPASN